MTAVFEIVDEQDGPRGWTFRAQLTDESGEMSQHAIELSWADYNLWSPDGSDAPASVAEAVMAFWLDRLGHLPVPERFDAATLRRIEPAADELLPRYIRPPEGGP